MSKILQDTIDSEVSHHLKLSPASASNGHGEVHSRNASDSLSNGHANGYSNGHATSFDVPDVVISSHTGNKHLGCIATCDPKNRNTNYLDTGHVVGNGHVNGSVVVVHDDANGHACVNVRANGIGGSSRSSWSNLSEVSFGENNNPTFGDFQVENESMETR